MPTRYEIQDIGTRILIPQLQNRTYYFELILQIKVKLSNPHMTHKWTRYKFLSIEIQKQNSNYTKGKSDLRFLLISRC